MTLEEILDFFTGLQKEIAEIEKENSDLNSRLQVANITVGSQQSQLNSISGQKDDALKTITRNDKAQKVIQTGLLQYGKPYKFSATRGQTNEFDCSSFTQYCFKTALGINLHSASYSQAQNDGSFINGLDNAIAGDLLCFDVGASRETWEGIDHVGIYCGNAKILHTYKVGVGVVFEELTDARKKQLKFIKRVIDL